MCEKNELEVVILLAVMIDFWLQLNLRMGTFPAQDSDTRFLMTSSLWSFPFPDTFEMVSEDEDGKVMFKVNYHYMSQVKNASDTNSAARSRRLAQEAVTLSTSLPLSSSSSVFVRCDEERLDIMKVKYDFKFLSTVLGPAPQTEVV